MNRERVVYRHDVFIDKNGIERPFCFCAVSNEMICTVCKIDSTEEKRIRVLFIGLSVLHSSDVNSKVYSKELAEKIAYGKASKDKSRVGKISTETPGFINNKVVETLLEQECNYFKLHPEKYIKGY